MINSKKVNFRLDSGDEWSGYCCRMATAEEKKMHCSIPPSSRHTNRKKEKPKLMRDSLFWVAKATHIFFFAADGERK